MTDSALDRLRRLPWLFTAGSCAFTALGVLVLGTLLVRSDTRERDVWMDGELRRVTSSVVRQVHADTVLDLTEVGRDELTTGCPEFVVVPGPTLPFEPYRSRRDCVPVDLAVLADLAERSVNAGSVQQGAVELGDGRRLRFAAEPFRRANNEVLGAVVAVRDTADMRDGHRRVVLSVVAGCLLLVLAVGVAGNLLARRAIRPAAAALAQQERLLADTAHDLRTPVAALRALAETSLLNPARRTELLPRTVELAARMGTIIDGVLMRARLAAGVERLAIEPVWLDQLVTTVVEETPTDGARVSVTAAPSRVDADPALVQRAIANLLDNALRHGRVAGQTAEVHITVAGGRVIVADHGPGIDPALARGTFDRFSSSGGSSGLGLSIVRWVAQAHGGALRVYNADEGGAIFELVLPDGGP